MCDKPSFNKIRESIAALQRENAVQTEQIKTIFKVTAAQGEQQNRLTARLVWAIIVALFISVLAVVYGALGQNGFNAVTHTATQAAGNTK